MIMRSLTQKIKPNEQRGREHQYDGMDRKGQGPGFQGYILRPKEEGQGRRGRGAPGSGHGQYRGMQGPSLVVFLRLRLKKNKRQSFRQNELTPKKLRTQTGRGQCSQSSTGRWDTSGHHGRKKKGNENSTVQAG